MARTVRVLSLTTTKERISKSSLLVAVAMLTAFGATASPAAAQTTAAWTTAPSSATVATLQPVVLPTLGGDTAFADGVNSAGVIVGTSTTSTGDFHAVVWRNGRIEDLGTLGGGSSEAYDIDDQGRIVGQSLAADNRYHAVMWQEVTTRQGRKPARTSWKITDLGVLGDGPWAEARDINNSGVIVGRYTTGQGFEAQFQGSRGFIRRDSTTTTLNLDPGVLPTALNDADQVVGIYRYTISPSFEITSRAFLWQNGTGRDLGTLGGQNTQAYAINNLGQVVGQAATADGRSVGFIWQAGSIRQLPIDQPDVQSYSAASINDAGSIVGTAAVDTLTDRALLWSSPSAQPQTLAVPAGYDSASASTIGPQGWVLGYAIRPTATSIAHSAVVWR